MKRKHKRKMKRALYFKKSTHLVLRLKENIPNLFCPRDKKLRQGFHQIASKYSIEIYELVFNHIHVHLLIKIPTRESYRAFIRELTSRCVNYWSKKTKVTLCKVFASRPYTRIIEWGRDFFGVKKYFEKNEKESRVLQLKNNSANKRQLNFLKLSSD